MSQIEFLSPEKTNTILATQIRSRHWVNVFGITKDGYLVVIEQWRFGSEELTLETPGGIVEKNEQYEDCAIREFREETGYYLSDLKYVNSLSPNPAVYTNKVHYYISFSCSYDNQPLQQDAHEYIDTALIKLKDFETLILNGKLTHALVVSGFYLVRPLLVKNKLLK